MVFLQIETEFAQYELQLVVDHCRAQLHGSRIIQLLVNVFIVRGPLKMPTSVRLNVCHRR